LICRPGEGRDPLLDGSGDGSVDTGLRRYDEGKTMPKSKIFPSFDAAVADIPDGSVVGFGGFAVVGQPVNLYGALAKQGAKGLT
jgi:hypothetical protein